MSEIDYANGEGSADLTGMDLIARRANVSKTTVHRALHGNGRISEATRQRILEIAEEIGYRRNHLASSLRTTRTATLGFVISGIQGSFYSRILEGAEDAARRAGFRTLLACTHGIFEEERRLVGTLLEHRVDGIVVSTSAGAADAPFYERLLQEGIRVVFIDRAPPGLTADLVATDHHLGGRLLGEHLVRNGARRPAFLKLYRQSRPESIDLRLAGYREAFAGMGVSEPVRVLEGDLVEMARRELARLGRPDEDPQSFSELCLMATREALRPHLSDLPFDAVFGQYDHLAASALAVLRDAEIPVPGAVRVVGFDDQDFTEYLTPSLTTIRQPLRQVGERAVERVLQRIDGFASDGERWLLAPRLIVRASSGAPHPAAS